MRLISISIALQVCYYLAFLALANIELNAFESSGFDTVVRASADKSVILSKLEDNEERLFIKYNVFDDHRLLQSSTSSGSAIRINAGSNTNWTDLSTGLVWMADAYSTDGWQYNGGQIEINGTQSDTLYCTHRSGGSVAYNINVPPGQYKVTLLFAEIYFDKPNQRVFKVWVQGQGLKSALDVIFEVGKNYAYNVSTIVTVTSSSINILLEKIIENVMISGIEIIPLGSTVPVPVPVPVPEPNTAPVPVPVPVPTPISTVSSSAIRINAGSSTNWTDPITNLLWTADAYTTDGWQYNGGQIEINGTQSDTIYCTHRSGGTLNYNINVSPGQYKVTLLFAEIFFDFPKQRIFKVSVQGQGLKSALDVLFEVGKNYAYNVSTTVTVASPSNLINILLEKIIENVMISGIEILPLGSTAPLPVPVPVTVPVPTPVAVPVPVAVPTPISAITIPAIRINAGSTTNWTDPSTGLVWMADAYTTDGWQYSGTPVEINGTQSDTLYWTHRSGGTVAYNINVPVGQYKVTLLFAEIYFDKPNQRVFKVSVQGQGLKSALDVIFEVGKNYAYSASTVVTVTSQSNNINVLLEKIIENVMISGIEILPVSVPVPAPPVPLQVPVPVPVPAPIAVPTPISAIIIPAIRINAGSAINWTDPSTGLVWMADAYTTDGWQYSGTPVEINGTQSDTLYWTHRSGGTVGYNVNVPAGLYKVTLLFAEIYFDKPNQRTFKVSVQGQVLKASLDVIAEVGKNYAYSVSTVATVTSPSNLLNILLEKIVENVMISGIEILPLSSVPLPLPVPVPSPTVPVPVPVAIVPAPVPVPVPVPGPVPVTAPILSGSGQAIRINAGSVVNWTDTATGLLWMADAYFTGGFPFSPGLLDIGKTDQDTVYSSHRGGSTTYSINVQPGQYTVRLMFAEIFFDKPNQRVFKVSIQGQVLKSALDVVAEVGMNNAYRLSTVIQVTSPLNQITIATENIIENAIISGIEIIPGVSTFAPTAAPAVASFTAIRINAGGSTWTDTSTNVTWDSDNYFNGGDGFSICPANITNTSLSALLCSHRSFGGPYGTIGGYNIPIPNGLYTVNLYFAETFWTSTKSRVFEVRVQGQSVASALDLVDVAGPKAAYKLTTVAAVAPVSTINYIRIEIVNILNNGLFSAIEILPYIPPVTPAPPPFPGIRINCGYDQPYVDALAKTWLPDQNYTGGTTWSKIVPDILNTANDVLFFYERIGDPFLYNITVPPAQYQVTLYFAENYFNKTGDRVMDIQVGDKFQTNFDILAVVPPMTATSLVFYPLVDQGVLTIQLSKSASTPNSAAPKLNAFEILMDAPHLAHAVARGPYYGTVSDASGKAKVSLKGEASHTHGPGLVVIDAMWKEGDQTLGNFLNIDYNFAVGNHTISLAIKDSGNNKASESTTVSIRPFGFPTITDVLPNSGSIDGNYVITLKGSGFTYPASSTTVSFGLSTLSGASVQVIDQSTIQFVCPPTVIAQRVSIIVKTPKGNSEEQYFDYIGSVPILWDTGILVSYLQPTTGRFGPDRKLYVGTSEGKMMKITFNVDFTQVVNNLVVQVNAVNDIILGIAFDPMDTKKNPDVYFNSNSFFKGGSKSTSGASVTGKIRMASGPNLEAVTTLISGLPVSDHDHGLNAMAFGDNGELYFALGSNTNGGVPGPLSGSKLLKENFLSAAINVAYLFHPDFNGTITWTADDDGNMIAKGIDIFAPGLRNPFGLEFHSNGKLYAQDNGPNTGYGAFSTGCADGQQIPEFNDYDEFNYVQKGKYYGHPNKKRASFFNDPRQCVWYSGLAKSDGTVTGALVTGFASRVGLTEFHSNHFGGQLRRNLISAQYGGNPSLNRLILNDDGTDIVPQSLSFIPLNIGVDSLDVTQAPNGNLIEFRYNGNAIYYHKPKESTTAELIVKAVFPHRGPSAGGNTLSVYGVNFGTTTAGANVTVGNSACAIISLTPTQIDCVLPGGIGAVDVVVSVGGATSTFTKSYRYISGLPPSGFVLPIYNGIKP